MKVNNKFPKWITANAVIPEIIKGNATVRVRQNQDERSGVVIYLLDLSHTQHMIPFEDISTFKRELAQAEMFVLDLIGFDSHEYLGEPITDEVMERMRADIEGLRYRYEMDNPCQYTIEDIIILRLTNEDVMRVHRIIKR